MKPTQNFRSLRRVANAFAYSRDGLKHAASHEAAFQQELIVVAVCSIAALLLPVSALLKVLLIASYVGVLIVELINTAVETLADRVCDKQDPLIKQAKDLGSAAVLLACIPAALLSGYALWAAFR